MVSLSVTDPPGRIFKLRRGVILKPEDELVGVVGAGAVAAKTGLTEPTEISATATAALRKLKSRFMCIFVPLMFTFDHILASKTAAANVGDRCGIDTSV